MVNLFILCLVINDYIPVVEYTPRRLQRNSDMGIFPAEIVKLGFVQPIADIIREYYNIHISWNIFEKYQCLQSDVIINHKNRFLGGGINMLVCQIRFYGLTVEYHPSSSYRRIAKIKHDICQF